MSTATLSPLSYSIQPTKKAQWSATQEKSILKDYPFVLTEEALDQFVARTYLQVLWLPESIQPLNVLVPSLQRVDAPSSSTAPHPLHELLEPLLLTARAASKKYQVELPTILAEGGGAGEIEETMMWFALEHEKDTSETGADGSSSNATSDANGTEPAAGPWLNEKWRHRYLERMERREVQIQILLYLLKLSLPGPLPPVPESPSKSKKRGRSAWKNPIEEESWEDRLEAFMDKLSMWQLVNKLDVVANDASKGKRDWMQTFCEDVVEPQFKPTLPELCSLLRSKVFPSSPFSDDESRATSRAGSPASEIVPNHPSTGVTPASSRFPSPAPAPSTSASSLSHQPLRKEGSISDTSRSLARSRSRSLSVSLAQERERERAASIGAVANKKRVLNREVSMSRVFKPKPKVSTESGSSQSNVNPTNANNKLLLPTARDGRNQNNNMSQSDGSRLGKGKSRRGRNSDGLGVTLVDDTPVKLHKTHSFIGPGPQSQSQSQANSQAQQTQSQLTRHRSSSVLVQDEEEFWNPSGSTGSLTLKSVAMDIDDNGGLVATDEEDNDGAP